MDLAAAKLIVRHIKYRDWVFDVKADGPGMYLQVRFFSDGVTWGGRKWRLSEHMTKSEVVQTAFLAVKTAEEHETRESFKYHGVAIFGPHLNADDLVGLIGQKQVRQDKRAEPGRKNGRDEFRLGALSAEGRKASRPRRLERQRDVPRAPGA